MQILILFTSLITFGISLHIIGWTLDMFKKFPTQAIFYNKDWSFFQKIFIVILLYALFPFVPAIELSKFFWGLLGSEILSSNKLRLIESQIIKCGEEYNVDIQYEYIIQRKCFWWWTKEKNFKDKAIAMSVYKNLVKPPPSIIENRYIIS